MAFLCVLFSIVRGMRFRKFILNIFCRENRATAALQTAEKIYLIIALKFWCGSPQDGLESVFEHHISLLGGRHIENCQLGCGKV